MVKYIHLMTKCALFDRIGEKDLLTMLSCLRAQVLSFEAQQPIMHQGSAAKHLGILLSGEACIAYIDETGTHDIVATLAGGDLFAETFAAAGCSVLPVSVIASSACSVLLLEYSRVITGCSNGCMAHSYLVTNLLHILACKNLLLKQKMDIIMKRTTREKLTAYLREQQKCAGQARFRIPFDRQGLADYLGVERSAMCAELSRMKKDGLIDYCKNEFTLIF